MTAHDWERYRFARTERFVHRAIRRFSGTHFSSLLRDQRGAAVVTLAVSFTGIAGLAGLGTEGANWYLTQRAMQGAADAAAHSAATAKSNGAGQTAFTATGKSVAANFNFSSSNGATVTVNSPPASGSHTSDGNAIEVVISEPMPRYLSGMFMSTGPTIKARSVALANVSLTAPACVVTLDHNSEKSLDTSGNPALSFNGCSLFVDSAGPNAANMSGSASIHAKAAYVVGSVSGSGLTTTDGTKTGVDPIKDPYASVSAPTGITTPCVGPNNYHFSGNGTYPEAGSCKFSGGLKVDGGSTLNLCPGTYVIDGGSVDLQGGAVLNAPPTATTTPPMSSAVCGSNTTGGVTIFLTNSTTGGNPATVGFGANAVVNLTAPTPTNCTSSGNCATTGIALFQDRVTCSGSTSACANNLTGGTAQNITGAIYFPNNSLNYSGNNSTGAGAPPCTQLVAYQITFTGNSQFNNSCTTAGTQTIGVMASQLVE